MLGVVDFWFGLGVDGLRLDAVPYLYERDGTNCENLPETHVFLKKLRAHVDARFKNRMLLAEANQWPEDDAAYYGSGDECHMNFHFPIMPRIFMSIQKRIASMIASWTAGLSKLRSGWWEKKRWKKYCLRTGSKVQFDTSVSTKMTRASSYISSVSDQT